MITSASTPAQKVTLEDVEYVVVQPERPSAAHGRGMTFGLRRGLQSPLDFPLASLRTGDAARTAGVVELSARRMSCRKMMEDLRFAKGKSTGKNLGFSLAPFPGACGRGFPGRLCKCKFIFCLEVMQYV